jgi:hypothetical protein
MRRDGCSCTRSLLASAFSVVAPRPAAGPTLAFLKLLLGSANAAFSGHLLLGILDPADELVAGQRRDVPPGSERRRVGDQRFAQVFRKLVNHPTGHSWDHRTRLAGCARRPRRVEAPSGDGAGWRTSVSSGPPGPACASCRAIFSRSASPFRFVAASRAASV